MDFENRKSIRYVPYYSNSYQGEICYNNMTSSQMLFYEYLKSEFEKKRKVEYNEDDSYGFINYGNVLAWDYLDELKYNGLEVLEYAIEKLERIYRYYNFLDDVSWYIADLYWLSKRYNKALEYYKLNPNETQTWKANHILNVKHYLGLSIEAPEILCIGRKLTRFGIENFDKIVEFVNIVLKQEELIRGQSYINYISDKYLSDKIFGWSFFGGYRKCHELIDIFDSKIQFENMYCYYGIEEFYDFCLEITRNAENLLREDLNIPRVGEGWIKETELYYKIKNHFSELEVIQHASPKWLGRQHLDIFIPKLSIAIEYHGRQHFEAVEHFGGDKALIETKKRDKNKRNKCLRNGIRLIEVNESYNFDELVELIESS